MISRRAFVVALSGAAAASAAVGQNKPAGEAPAAPQISAEAEARVQLILGKWGARLTDSQKVDIHRVITGGQPGFDAFRAYPLDNSVEPATLFRVYRKGGKP
jgi:hypothetical protein